MTNMKALIKQLIPPMAIQIFAKLRRGQLRSRRYSSFADATLACRNGAYQSNALVRVVVEKNSIYEQNLKSNPVLDLSNLGALLSLGIANLNGRLNVLDFGGAGGHHYTIANIAFGVDHPVRWNVVETAAMAMAAQTRANDRLKFFDNLDAAKADLKEVDLVFTSSALQYCPDPLVSLERLANLGARYLFITKTPFLEGSDCIITVQRSRASDNGPGPMPEGFSDGDVTYPITYVSRSTVEEILRRNYEIRFTTAEGRGVFGFRAKSITMTGYFCVRRH